MAEVKFVVFSSWRSILADGHLASDLAAAKRG